MTCNDEIITVSLERGTDVLNPVEYRDDDGNPINMTGWTIAIFEADAWMMANATIVWTDQANGDALLRADWTTTTPAECWVRIRATQTSDGFDDALPIIKIVWS